MKTRREHPEWDTERQGYVRLSRNDRNRDTILQHRVVLEDKLGRALRPGETAHHINGIRDDNRPENLELWDTSQPPGQRVGDRVAHVAGRYPAETIQYLLDNHPELMAEAFDGMAVAA